MLLVSYANKLNYKYTKNRTASISISMTMRVNEMVFMEKPHTHRKNSSQKQHCTHLLVKVGEVS